MEMDTACDDLNSIIEFLPVDLRSTSLTWRSRAHEVLTALSKGPQLSGVDSGGIFFNAILDIRNSLDLPRYELASHAADGYALFFDDLIAPLDSRKWFAEVLPSLAMLLLRLPSLLEEHYKITGDVFGQERGGPIIRTRLRILASQEAGIVFLTQELIGAMLSCSLFCLYPGFNRDSKHLPIINFDHLFGALYTSGRPSQEHKIKCLKHYFERICSHMPRGFVSFERKVLSSNIYPDAEFWSKSMVTLSSLEISDSGCIEDQQHEALEVDFANKYIGGGALHTGSVQEEIRFMINPELIAGMLFLPCMADNEAIEIAGPERFSDYTGYRSTFRFKGDYIDNRQVDLLGRRKTRIVAIDALPSPGMGQYTLNGLLRESNKALCGFFNQWHYQKYLEKFQQEKLHKETHQHDDVIPPDCMVECHPVGCMVEKCRCSHVPERSLISASILSSTSSSEPQDKNLCVNSNAGYGHAVRFEDNTGVVTGNWGCGAFGGDPELKCIIQWLATSQALRPFILYYTFQENALQRLKKVSKWIISHGWTVGDLWNMLVEYSSQRLCDKTRLGFLDWLLPFPGSAQMHQQNIHLDSV